MNKTGYLDTYAPSLTPDPVYDLEVRMIKALALINSEFTSDPMSVQCFDLGLVQEVRELVSERVRLENNGTLPPLVTS